MNFDPRAVRRANAVAAGKLAENGAVLPSPATGKLLVGSWFRQSNPAHYNRRRAFLDAVNLCTAWCSYNAIPIPVICDAPLQSQGKLGLYKRHQLKRVSEGFGCDEIDNDADCLNSHFVYVDVAACCAPGDIRADGIHWPGAAADSTVAGVTAHEIGHLAHYSEVQCGAHELQAKMWKFRGTFIDSPIIVRGDVNEIIAEALRLFIMNPSYLQYRLSAAYDVLAQYFEPLPDSKHWTEILGGYEG